MIPMSDRSDLWWRAKDREGLGRHLVSHADFLANESETRLEAADLWDEIYSGRLERATGDKDPKTMILLRAEKIPVIRSMVEATASRLARAQPLPDVSTIDGDWELQQRAKGLTEWLQGMFHMLAVHENMADVLHDALIQGLGVAKVWSDIEGLHVDRVDHREIFVEKREAKYNRIRSIYQISPVDRWNLAAAFDDAKNGKALVQAIEGAPRWLGRRPAVDNDGVGDWSSDMVRVIEGWRLGYGGKPGRHVMALEDGTVLLDEPWERKRLPFVFVPWRRVPGSLFAQGMVEGAAPQQKIVNETIKDMAECFRRSFPSVWINDQANVAEVEVKNSKWSVHKYSGSMAPVFMTPPAFSDDYWTYLRSHIEFVYEMSGVSQLWAQSIKPQGLNSGKSLLVFQDIESERFLTQGRAYEKAHMQIAELLIEEAEEIYKKDLPSKDKLRVLGGRKQLKAFAFADVRFGDNPFQIRCFPVTSLSASLSGKLAQVRELVETGVIQPDKARELLNYPDLERFNSIESAGTDLVDKTITQILRTGTPKPASVYMPLDYAVSSGTVHLMLADIEGAPESHLDALRIFVQQATDLLEQSQPPAPPMPPGADAGMAPDPGMMPAPGMDMGGTMAPMGPMGI